jgi:hypothetical protein
MLSAAPARHRDLFLATASAAAAAIVAATAVADYVKILHGIHLLSNRRMSMGLRKKRLECSAPALQSYWLITFTSFSALSVSGANFNIICPQQIAIRS